MPEQKPALSVRPRILYQVAKAAWEGTLLENIEKICSAIHQEYEDSLSRHYVANQIRIAMGLPPHESDTVVSETDEEALMGLGSYPVIIPNTASCTQCERGARPCEQACPFQAIAQNAEGKTIIDYNKCFGEGYCVDACTFGVLAQKSQFIPLIKLLRQQSSPVYVSIAPAFAGQFGEAVTPGKLRSALLKLGFTDMIETALYADLVTMKEAFEFDDHVKNKDDFLITSCCCPVWIKLIENKFPALTKYISPSVSPMVASARIIKALEPSAKVVFIGPCVAKKSEAVLPDLVGAVDFVLTFQELQTIFDATDINPANQPDEENPLASWGGRIYGYTGGVSAAVEATLEKLLPRRSQAFRPIKVDGIPDCQTLLTNIQNSKIEANFIEGMACKGGCVGGPGRLIAPEQGQKHVSRYGDDAKAQTPVENPNVYAVLNRLNLSGEDHVMTGESHIGELLARKITMV